jgi:FtsP/CotA-like multicopper oxidase with cupredoxin domain
VGLLGLIFGFLIETARAQDAPELIQHAPELIQPPICSKATASSPALKGICEVTPLQGGYKVKINLSAEAAPIEVGGYIVDTENYNGSYLTPVVEAMPGDTVAVHLENLLPPRTSSNCHDRMHSANKDQTSDGQKLMGQGDLCENPTNLHFFHGGIVTPRNSREEKGSSPASAKGDPKNLGDNIYAFLRNGFESPGKSYSVDFNVPIPKELDGRVLEDKAEKLIAYPLGLNWYHSHLHGISSDQVMGGMSGLLSVGEGTANVKAKCEENTPKTECESNTADLRNRTDVRYVLLRDIPLKMIGDALPPNAGKAIWAPEMRDFSEGDCGVWNNVESTPDKNPILRRGFCQRDRDSAWLFTLNGQRFPKITVNGGLNLLLRLGNLSANVAYWLELYKVKIDTDGTIVPVLVDGKIVPVPLTILSLDGVVPAKPSNPKEMPIEAFNVDDLLLMPASRAEIYVRNDGGEVAGHDTTHSDTQTYVLRTKGPNMGRDHWPEIQLALIVLQPNIQPSSSVLALNAPTETETPIAIPLPHGFMFPPQPPPGCVRDLNPQDLEHRRVTFFERERNKFSIGTEIVRPPDVDKLADEGNFKPDPKETIGELRPDGITLKRGIPFEDYELQGGEIDWQGLHTGAVSQKRNKHVCIEFRPGARSHKQLWVLRNKTGSVHNFHIHQMKFRLATREELKDYKIDPPKLSHTCAAPTPDDPCNSIPSDQCEIPEDYKFYEDGCSTDSKTKWHDTIPVPIFDPVFLIMSFDDERQVGRYVFHCHILKHEDNGLMAPIEVWNPNANN